MSDESSTTHAGQKHHPRHQQVSDAEPAPHHERPADPHGAAPAADAAKDEPKGLPTSDRHQMETAISKQSEP